MNEDIAASAPVEAENIAVCIRVRPMNERENRCRDAHALRCVPSMNVVSFMDPETGAPLSGKNNVFQYDEIFDASSDTHAIYARVGRRIVRSTLGGINGTIFAYGQTSSGKTFTMQGDGEMSFEPEAKTSHPGLLQLAVEDIFQFIETCADRDFLLRVSFLEIYNEVVRDLLNPTEKGANLKLREDPRKGVYVECHEKIITDYEDIVTLLQTGNQNRTVGQTAMNEKSSRSHSVFRIVIESKEKAESRRLSEDDVDGAVLVASLNLVDLAGSESLRHTGAEGIRQREAGNINKSLLTLARVINALATPGGGGQNAPFRDSKLTRLLQNSLGGNTRTLIICCVTPSDRFIEETKSTLQFAARAKDIKTVATVNEVLDDQTQLRRLKREVHELKKLTKSETLSALKAENKALIIEKNHNRSEITRLMGLILSSSSVAKANTTNRERKRRGKRMRETWGPGDFLDIQRDLQCPRKRHSPAKENRDPEPLLRILEDVDENPAKLNSPVINLSPSQHKPKRTGLDDSSKKLLDLFSSVLQSYHDKNCEDPIAAAEAIMEEKSAYLGDIERTHALDVLASIKTLMMTNIQSKRVMDEKLMLDLEVKELWSKLDSARFDSRSSETVSRVDELAEKFKSELDLTLESLDKARKRCRDLEVESANAQQMASEEISLLRYQLEILKVESNGLRQRFDRKNLQVAAIVNTLKSRLSLDNGNFMSSYNRSDGLEPILEDVNASQTVHRPTIEEEIVSPRSPEKKQSQVGPECYTEFIEKENNALRQTKLNTLSEQSDLASSNCEKKSQDSVSVAEQRERAIVDKLANELQSIMQELAQLQSDHEKAALEKAELQAETDKMCEEVEITQRQMREMSEKLMEKEHQAKVLQAQLNAKLMTISQMQARHEKEVDSMQQMIQELTSQNEQYSKARDDVTAELEKVSCEHSNCLEELRALESQLMQVSEEKITLAVAADEHKSKLREAQQEVLSAASTISMLQAELNKIQSEKASVEASKNAAEHNMQKLQTAWTSLQADYAAMVEQVQCRGTVLSQNESCATETNRLQQRLEVESIEREKLQLDIRSYEDMLLVLRKEAKQSSEKVLDLLEKVKLLETDLIASARTLEEKDKEVSRLTNALARIEEENEELRLQIKQRLVVTEEKEIALQEKISELEKQMNARELEHQSMVKTLENHLVATQQELYTKNEAWNEKLASAERPGACLIAEHSQLCDEVSRLRREVEVARQAKDAQAEEKVKAQGSCSELVEQVETMQRELEAANALWAEKQHDLVVQVDSIREELNEAQAKLKKYEEIAGGTMHGSNSCMQASAEVEKKMSELQQKYTAAQTQHATYEAKLKEMEAQLEMSENEVTAYRRELKSLAESLQSAEKQAATYHDELMVAQAAKESMEELIAKQKARIDKLDKVKMTTEIFDLFQTLKKGRADLQVTVCNLQKDLAQAEAALAQSKGKED